MEEQVDIEQSLGFIAAQKRILKLEEYCHTVEGAHTGMRFNGWTFEQNTRLGQTGLDKAWK